MVTRVPVRAIDRNMCGGDGGGGGMVDALVECLSDGGISAVVGATVAT